ncbi:ribonuclease J [Periweissella fabalis]|uniref:Ribonuclease J n=1 Tax=Periweissella fabalis TaxID=1070421 RepID=A0A7X6N616_9LACO|nr:ribonuclease J [Periweissella fabalis]MCM0598761.1 ribonuclease J [Periweissella fabalis]NKZ24640.1 ribonuclease J [Periweissella fabalis]
MTNKLSIIPFGGVRENGKNMYAVTYNDEIFIFDAGLKYPENELLGIDVVIPDFQYLVDNADKIAGVFLTHGHADAIGALPYLLAQINVPVFGSELTLALAKLAVKAEELTKEFDDFHVVNENSIIDFGDIKVSFFSTTHTIPQSLGIVLETPEGQIVYTGDFKFDQTAKDSYRTDLTRLGEIGKNGVLALLADVAGVASVGASVNESVIEDYILDTFQNHTGRIIVAMVASNVQRVQQIINATYATGRKIVLSGNDLEKVVRTALKLRMIELPIPENELFVSFKNLRKLNPEETVILETGRMGEPIKHLQRMANGDDRHIKIATGDLVFITTTPSSAMEAYVARTRDMLFKAGANVKAISQDLRSSGHASGNDLQLMLNFMRPKVFLPVQGEYRVLNTGMQLAMEVGIPQDHIFITQKGDQLQYDGENMYLAGSFEVNNTMIDGSGIGDIGNIVLRDRKVLSEDGVFVAVVTIDRRRKKIVAKPKITSRGFVYVKASRDLIRDSSDIVEKTILDNLANVKDFDWTTLKTAVRDNLSHFLYEQTRRRPVILPVIMEVNQNGGRLARHNRTSKSGEGKTKAKAKKLPINPKVESKVSNTGIEKPKKAKKPRRRKPKPAQGTNETSNN